jgi:hypothetical protein
VSIKDISDYDPERYLKTEAQTIKVLFQKDAFFLVSGFSKLTIGLAHYSFGELLALQELEPSAN